MMKELHVRAEMMKEVHVLAEMTIDQNDLVMKNPSVGNGQVNVRKQVTTASEPEDQVAVDQVLEDQVQVVLASAVMIVAVMIAHVAADLIVPVESLLDEIVMNVHLDMFRKNESMLMIR
jgi:hypothetical protein